MRTSPLLLAALTAFIVLTPLTADAGVRLYGNWCGPASGMNGYPSVDPLDAACMRHDFCYSDSNSISCQCDVSLMRELRAMSYPNPTVQDAARAMYDALAMTPCDDPTGWALKLSMMWSVIANVAVSCMATHFNVPRRLDDQYSRIT